LNINILILIVLFIQIFDLGDLINAFAKSSLNFNVVESEILK